MAINFDSALGINEQALYLRSKRAEVIANNLANADTPGFKARDFDFKAALAGEKARHGRLDVKTTDSRHISTATAPGEPELLYRVPLQPSLDGNSVDDQFELANYSKNTMDFQASFYFLNSKFVGLKNAIRGEA